MRAKIFLTGAMCGGLVGAVATLLIAPMGGQELRSRARTKFSQLVAETKRATSERQRELRAQIDELASRQDEA